MMKKNLFLMFFVFTTLIVSGQAVLPLNTSFSDVSTSGSLDMPSGFTHSGLSAYASALKFDTQNDWLVLNFDSAPGVLSFDIGVNNVFSASMSENISFEVQESTNGTEWSLLKVYSNMPCGEKSISNFKTESRYIRWIYSIKVSGKNIALKDIRLTADDSCIASDLNFVNPELYKVEGESSFFVLPTSLNLTSPLTFFSSNVNVATVNSLSGEVAIVGVGSTVISASQIKEVSNLVNYCASVATYTLYVTSNKPTITITEVIIPDLVTSVGNFVTETVDVDGLNLVSDIFVSITEDPDGQFEDPSVVVISKSIDNTAKAIVVVTYKPTTIGTHTALLTFSSEGAKDITRTLTGVSTDLIGMPPVIITEVYGGGGNAGATYKNDFVELYNTTSNSIDIGGWSLQYYTATGLTPTNYVFPANKFIPAKSYFLVQGSGGINGSQSLPTPDHVFALLMSATNGKIILFKSNVSQLITDINSITENISFVDYVPFGQDAVPVYGSVLKSPSNVTSASRKFSKNTFVYTANVGSDFELVEPNPISSLSLTDVPIVLTSTIHTTLYGDIVFFAKSGVDVEIYNVIGQRLITEKAIEGINSIHISQKGIILVKVGELVTKVIL